MTRDFNAQEAQFKNKEQKASFNSMKVGEAASFRKAVFEGPVDIRFADFAWLDLSRDGLPKIAGSFDMKGMTYRHVQAVKGNERESHEKLLKLAERSPYTADVYRKLEHFFLTQGYRDDADKVFVAGKRRERREYLSRFERLASWLLDQVVRYGRQPSRAGIFCVFFVAFGAALFSPKRMELQQVQTMPRIFNRFWYSLGLFLPIVNLESDKVWKPKADQTFLRNYMRVHILLGWILVPLVLAALTGLIK